MAQLTTPYSMFVAVHREVAFALKRLQHWPGDVRKLQNLVAEAIPSYPGFECPPGAALANKAYLRIASDWLNEAASEFGDHGCNDYKFPTTVSREEQQMILSEGSRLGVFHPSELQEHLDQLPYCADFVVMYCLAAMLKEAAA